MLSHDAQCTERINIQLMSLDEQQHQNLHDFFLLLFHSLLLLHCCRVEFRSSRKKFDVCNEAWLVQSFVKKMYISII